MSEQVKPHQHDHSGLKLSIILSTICLIHCITFPILIAVFALFSVAFHPPIWIEFSLLGGTAALGYYSMRHGLTLHYHSKWPLIIFTIGIIGAFAIHILPYSGANEHVHVHEFNLVRTLLEIFFALLIAASQVINYRMTKNHACTSSH